MHGVKVGERVLSADDFGEFSAPALNLRTYLNRWHNSFTVDRRSIFPIGITRYLRSSFRLEGKIYRSAEIEGPDHGKKLQLMREQSAMWQNCGCLLCRNLEELAAPGAQAGLLYRSKDSVVIPNRYPSHIGHGLALPVEHRAQLTKDDLLSAALLSEKTNCVATKNHARDAASIPGHVHFHLIPLRIGFPLIDALEAQFGRPDATLRVEQLSSKLTPFSALMISDCSVQALITKAWEVISRLEDAGEVYTLAYYGKRLLISPRKTSLITDPLKLGALVPLHIFGGTDPHAVARHIPTHGEFDWAPFLQERLKKAA